MLVGLRRLILAKYFSSKSQEAHNSASSSKQAFTRHVTKLDIPLDQTGWTGPKITCNSMFEGPCRDMGQHISFILSLGVCVILPGLHSEEKLRCWTEWNLWDLSMGQEQRESVSATFSSYLTPEKCLGLSGLYFSSSVNLWYYQYLFHRLLFGLNVKFFTQCLAHRAYLPAITAATATFVLNFMPSPKKSTAYFLIVIKPI